MRKLSFISILFLFMIVYTTAVHAMSVGYNVTATAPVDNWVFPDSTILLQMTIDTSKLFYYTQYRIGNDTNVYSFTPDHTTLLIDGLLNTEWDWADISLTRYGGNSTLPGADYPHDEVLLRLGTDLITPGDKWDLAFWGTFPKDFLGPMPFSTDLEYDISMTDEVYGTTHYQPPNGNHQLISVSEFSAAPVPEPTTMLLFGAGLVGLAGFGRKKFKR